MPRILTIIALLFATPAWADEVDGNSFFCEPSSESPNDGGYSAVIFEDGLVSIYREWGGVGEDTVDYFSDNRVVAWSVLGIMKYEINRKTLLLKLNIGDEAISFWNCRFETKEKAIYALTEAGQERVRREREGNQF